MNAHQELERQLRTSVAHDAGRRPSVRLRHWLRSRGSSSLLLALSCAVVSGSRCPRSCRCITAGLQRHSLRRPRPILTGSPGRQRRALSLRMQTTP